MELKGIFVPNVTPFLPRGDIDYESLGALVGFWLGAGVSGLVVNASTGEAPLLSQRERVDLIKFVKGKMDSNQILIAGTGTVGTRETVDLTKDAKEAGAEIALVSAPYFFKPTEEEIFKHFSSLMTIVDFPVILYNVPKFTGYNIPPKVVYRIANEFDNLIGIKDSSGSPGNMAENIRLFGEKISVLSGAADMTLPTLAMGGKGAILAVANVIPEVCVELYEAAKVGDLNRAGNLQLKVSYVNKVLVRERPQVAAVKSALKSLSYPAGVPRMPLLPLSKEEEFEVIKALNKL